MLSSSFNIIEFVQKAKGHSYEDIIWMADNEATAAERCLFKRITESDRAKVLSYSGCLKDLILFMRHGVRTRKIKALSLESFGRIRLEH
ncbi:MAG: hypothetical protein M0036_26450 [Desulfobacteraceae bacterium]|nr:hypothetical protein [Desulfobacteraceae bacterium]